MPKTDAFNRHYDAYEDWFVRFPSVFEAERRALAALIDSGDCGVEIGVGTGRFAAALGICDGVEPSAPMAEIARRRGIHVLEGYAELLPYRDDRFDFALMVTTICFVDDPLASFREAFRVTRENGYVIIGFVDAQSPIGRHYQANRRQSRFYAEAEFFSHDELTELLRLAGFARTRSIQTLFGDLADTPPDEPVKEGFGQGSFVAIRADKS